MVVQRAHNEHLLLRFTGPGAFELRLSRVFRLSLGRVLRTRVLTISAVVG
jgi:hypothetical protein